MLTIDQVTQAIMHGSFTNDELNSVSRAITYRRAEIGRAVKRTIRVGDTVEFFHPKKGITLRGPVTALKIKNVVVSTQSGNYRVPASLLTVV